MKFCVICRDYHNSDSMVRCGKRHYACYSCYVIAAKPLNKLSDSDLLSFPWRLVRDHNLEPAIVAILDLRKRARLSPIPGMRVAR